MEIILKDGGQATLLINASKMQLLKKIFFGLLILLVLGIIALFFAFNTHVGIGEYEKWYEGIDTTPSVGTIKVQFAGVSTLLISDDSTHILTDGFFSRFSTQDMLFGKIEPQTADIQWAVDKMDITQLDAILVVHSHFDHAMDAPEVAKLTGATMYGSESTANIGRGWNLPENQIKVFQSGVPLYFGQFKVTPILSNHFEFPDPEIKEQALGGNQEITAPLVPPVPALAYKMGGAYTFLFEHPKGSFILQSSAGWKEGSLAGIQVDKVIMGVGGLGSQTEAYQATYFKELVDNVGATKVYLIHWDAFSGSIRQPIQGPSVFLDWYAGKTKQSFQAIERETQKRSEISIHLLPQWENVNF